MNQVRQTQEVYTQTLLQLKVQCFTYTFFAEIDARATEVGQGI